jgi:cyclic pyranopterin phosphate synthase
MKALENLFDGKPREPHLRVAVTPYCNFNCLYCKPGGEGCPANGKLMTLQELIKLIELASEAGFRHVKFTGGEPLLREDIAEVIRNTKNIRHVKEVGLVTNGSFLKDYAASLKEAGLDRIAVSLDAASPELFEKISGTKLFDKVLEGIAAARSTGIPLTINTVLMNSNRHEVKGLIDIAYKNNSQLKLIDFMNISDKELWEKEYFPPQEIVSEFENDIVETKWRFAFAGLGSPLPAYKLKNGVEIRIKDASVGTNYHANCTACRLYPCQDAVISLRVTHDGKLKRCLIRNDNLIDILPYIQNSKIEKAKQHFKDLYKIFSESKFFPNAWKPEVERRNNKNDI